MRNLGRDNALIALALLFWGLGSGLYQFIWPLYIKSLGASSLEIGFALAFGSVIAIMVFIPGGIVADRYNRKKNLVASWVIGTAAVLVYAFAQDWRQLLFGIALMSISQFCDPALSAYIAEAGEGRDLGQTFTLVFGAMSLGMIVSPSIGALIMETGNMRPLFYAAFVMFALSTVAMSLIRDRPRTTHPTTAGQGYGTVLLNWRMVGFFTLFLAMYIAIFLGRSFSPVYLEEVSGLQRSQIGSLGSFLPLGSVVSALLVGTISSRLGIVWAIMAAQGLVLLGYAVFLPFAGVIPAAMAYFLWGSGNSVGPLSRAVLGKELAIGSAGRGYAVQNVLNSLAMTVAPSASGWLYSLRQDLPFLVAIALLPLLIIATTSLRRYGLQEEATTSTPLT